MGIQYGAILNREVLLIMNDLHVNQGKKFCVQKEVCFSVNAMAAYAL